MCVGTEWMHRDGLAACQAACLLQSLGSKWRWYDDASAGIGADWRNVVPGPLIHSGHDEEVWRDYISERSSMEVKDRFPQ